MDEIRAFLLKSDTIEEAEGILVDNMLKRSHDSSSSALRRSVLNRPADGDQQTSATAISASTTDTDSNVNRLDYLKIHDLLSSFEEAPRGRQKASSSHRPQHEIQLSNQPSKMKLRELQSIEESTADELLELQSRQKLLQDRYVSTRSELERQRILYNNIATDGGHIDKHDYSYRSSNMHKRLSNHVEQEVNTKNKASMNQLFELTQQHAKKLALNSIESMEYQRELDLIRAGDWSIDRSFLRNATRPSKLSLSEAVPTVTASQQAQAAEVQELRRQAAAHRSDLQSDPLIQQLDGMISKDKRRQLSAGTQEESLLSLPSNTKLYLDRKESASDYLDRWLLSSESTSIEKNPRTGTVGGIPDGAQVSEDAKQDVNISMLGSPSPSSSRMEIKDHSDQELNTLQRQGLSTLNVRDKSEERMPNNLRPPHQNPPLKEYPQPRPSLQQYPAQQNPSAQQYPFQQNPFMQRYRHQNNLPVQQNPPLFQPFPQYPPQINQNPQLQPYQQRANPLLQQFPQPFPSFQPYPYPSSYNLQFQQQADPLFQQYPTPQIGPFQQYPQHQLNPYQQYSAQQVPPWQQVSPHPYVFQNNPPAQQHSSPINSNPIADSQSALSPANAVNVQKLLDALELENMKLLKQLDPKAAPDLIEKGLGPISARDSYKDRGINDLYQLERDRRSGKIGRSAYEVLLTKDDIKHADEMRKLDYEIEKIRGQQKLDVVRAEYSKQKEDRETELKHQKWLTQSKQELQQVKLQQVRASFPFRGLRAPLMTWCMI